MESSDVPDLKRPKEEKLSIRDGAESDGEKSDADLVVDVANEEGLSPGAAAGSGTNGDTIRENGDVKVKIERPASQSGSSSNRSTPSLKSKEVRSLGKIFFPEEVYSLNDGLKMFCLLF